MSINCQYMRVSFKDLLRKHRLLGSTAGRDHRTHQTAFSNRNRPDRIFLLDFRRADGDCRDLSTDDVIMSMTQPTIFQRGRRHLFFI